LMDSLRIAIAIKENGSGNPYDRLDLAKALSTKPSTQEFRSLVTSSGKFGLTQGSYVAKKIGLTPLGRAIVYPESVEEKNKSLREAFFKIPFYKKFFEAYDNNRLPSWEFLEGTLSRTYSIPAEETKECHKLVIKNAKELGILEDLGGGSQYIHLVKLGGASATPLPDNVTTEKPLSPPNVGGQLPVSVPLVNPPIISKDGIVVKVNINFELPITKEAEVYDKIFQSLKRNILSPDSKAD
jgi:hypothetical protein